MAGKRESGDVIGQIQAVAARVAASYGLEIFDVQFRREAQGMVLRVRIDRPGPASTAEDSVSVDDCAQVSRDLSAILDVARARPAAATRAGLRTLRGAAGKDRDARKNRRADVLQGPVGGRRRRRGTDGRRGSQAAPGADGGYHARESRSGVLREDRGAGPPE